jgi:hypothetical protein
MVGPAACVQAELITHHAKWRNDKHAAQWRSTLNTYAKPAFGNVAVQLKPASGRTNCS